MKYKNQANTTEFQLKCQHCWNRTIVNGDNYGMNIKCYIAHFVSGPDGGICY